MPVVRFFKYKACLNLAKLIKSNGFKIPICSYCERNRRKCVASDNDSAQCSECVRQGGCCDIEALAANDFLSVLLGQELLALLRKETLTKLLRLDKQQKLNSKMAHELIRCSLKTIDELEEAEEKERQEAGQHVRSKSCC